MYRLKEATQAYHRQVEAQVEAFDGWAHSAQYVGLLRCFYGYYQPVEERLGALPWSTLGCDFNERRKSQFLAQDLLTLGETVESLAHLPRCVDLPALATLTQGLGTLYVLEGATLGGAIILRRVQRTLAITPAQGGAFFYSYGERRSVMWQMFAALMNQYMMCDTSTATDARAQAIIDAASATFQSMGRWLAASVKAQRAQNLGRT